MIEKMEKIYIYSLRSQSTDIMEDLLKCGTVQPTQTESMLDAETAALLQPGESLDLTREEHLQQQLQESISALKDFGKKKSMFSK